MLLHYSLQFHIEEVPRNRYFLFLYGFFFSVLVLYPQILLETTAFRSIFCERSEFSIYVLMIFFNEQRGWAHEETK